VQRMHNSKVNKGKKMGFETLFQPIKIGYVKIKFFGENLAQLLGIDTAKRRIKRLYW
jgi:hypothetical protein